MNLGIPFNRKDILCIPRVSGDEPDMLNTLNTTQAYSPHGRG